MTNREKINAMDNRRLAIWITTQATQCTICAVYPDDMCGGRCEDGIAEWLDMEAVEDAQ